MKVYIQRKVKHPKVLAAPAKRYMRDVLSGEGVTEGSLTLVLTDDDGIQELNAAYRDKDRPTDVLAFPFGEEDENGLYLGDVVISLERAVSQAPRFHNPPERELARLITHGILHLLGYDHHTPQEGKRMKQAERRALAHHRPGSLMVPDHA